MFRWFKWSWGLEVYELVCFPLWLGATTRGHSDSLLVRLAGLPLDGMRLFCFLVEPAMHFFGRGGFLLDWMFGRCDEDKLHRSIVGLAFGGIVLLE